MARPTRNGSAVLETSTGETPVSWFVRQTRETAETVVFVLVLVSLLRMFGCEAFVIPTGSMATTLLGAHKAGTCPQCEYTSTVNASDQLEHRSPVTNGLCQNCRYRLDLAKVKPSGGDRVLVSKFLYEGFADPQRWEVVVFKVPEVGKWPDNTFIKRLIGRSNEIVGIRNGDIHIRPVVVPEGGTVEYQIARKPPQVMMAVRRLVYDNDLPAADLERANFPARWQTDSGQSWTVNEAGNSFESSGKADGTLTYRQILRDDADADLITDFEAYNSGPPNPQLDHNWVGDLMLDCTIKVQETAGKIVIELGEGKRRYGCVLNLKEQRVELQQNEEKLAEKAFILGTGTYHLQFANFDDRLTLWLDGNLLFGDGVEVKPLSFEEIGPTEQDLEPVKIKTMSAAVAVADLQLYRDIYYTQTAQSADVYVTRIHGGDWLGDLRMQLGRRPMKEFVVPDNSFFMLGDNSPKSSDGREWSRKFVGRHLVLGRALILYWPFWNWKFVR